MVEMPKMDEIHQAIEEAEKAVARQTPPMPRRRLKQAAIALALLAGTVLAGDYGYDYWMTGQYLESTDDAYIQADSTVLAPKVSGYIAEILVRDNQPVKAGQVLARIDDRDYRTALAQAKADEAAADAAIRNLDAQITLQRSTIEQARAVAAATQASLTYAEADASRYSQLLRTGAGSVQKGQQTDAASRQLTAQLQGDQAALMAAQAKTAVLATGREQAVAQRDHSRAVVQQAELNLSYTAITAPVDGTVGARSLRTGQYVTAGTQLMAVVPLDAVYVVANFKETQLADVRAGQTVEVSVDGIPGRRVKGHVDSLSPASGLEFALLPPDNATGNFTKIVQRVPVKIVFDDTALNGLLRPGMSVEPTIDTKAAVPAR